VPPFLKSSHIFLQEFNASVEDDEDLGAEVDADDDEAVLCLAAIVLIALSIQCKKVCYPGPRPTIPSCVGRCPTVPIVYLFLPRVGATSLQDQGSYWSSAQEMSGVSNLGKCIGHG
jgi:hypothetical protein